MEKRGRRVVGVVLLVSACSSGGAATSGTGGTGVLGGDGANGGVAGTAGSFAVGTNGDLGGMGGGATDGAGSAGLSNVTVRLANAFLPKGKTTGPAIDIYDDMKGFPVQASVSGKPIIAGVAYGTISDYVRVHFYAPNYSNVQLVALPAGSPSDDTGDAQVIWGGGDESSNLQVTVLLTGDAPMGTFGPLNLLYYREYVEKGVDDANNMKGPLAPASPSGQGEILVCAVPVDVAPFSAAGGFSIFLDDSCLSAPGSGAALLPYGFTAFPASPGVHELSVVGWNGSDTPPCDELLGRRQGTTTVNLAEGQQIIAIVYGSSLADLHLMFGPISP